MRPKNDFDAVCMMIQGSQADQSLRVRWGVVVRRVEEAVSGGNPLAQHEIAVCLARKAMPWFADLNDGLRFSGPASLESAPATITRFERMEEADWKHCLMIASGLSDEPQPQILKYLERAR